MSQKKIKQYQRAGRKAAQRLISDNIKEIQNQLISSMVNENFKTRVIIAWRIIFKRVQVKDNGKQ